MLFKRVDREIRDSRLQASIPRDRYAIVRLAKGPVILLGGIEQLCIEYVFNSVTYEQSNLKMLENKKHDSKRPSS